MASVSSCISAFTLIPAAKWLHAYELEKCFTVLKLLFKDEIVRDFYTSFGIKTADIEEFIQTTEKPMNLQMVESKVRQGLYHSAEEFAADVRLIVTNAFRFLPENSYRLKKVKRLSHAFEYIYADYGVEPVYRCYDMYIQDMESYAAQPGSHQDNSEAEVKPAVIPVYEDISEDEDSTAGPLSSASEASSQTISYSDEDEMTEPYEI